MVERNIGKVCFLTKAHKLMLSCLKHRFGIISFFLLRHVLLCLICLFETASLTQTRVPMREQAG